MQTDRVLQIAIDDLGLNVSPETLAENVTATSPIRSAIIDISVMFGVAETGAEIANALGRSLIDTIDEIEGSGATESGLEVVVLQEAAPASAPLTPNVQLNLVAGLSAGSGLGVGLAVLSDLVVARAVRLRHSN